MSAPIAAVPVAWLVRALEAIRGYDATTTSLAMAQLVAGEALTIYEGANAQPPIVTAEPPTLDAMAEAIEDLDWFDTALLKRAAAMLRKLDAEREMYRIRAQTWEEESAKKDAALAELERAHPPVPVAAEPVVNVKEAPNGNLYLDWLNGKNMAHFAGASLYAHPPALSEEFIQEVMRLAHKCISLAIKAEIERGTKAAIANEDAEADALVAFEAHLRSKG